MSWLRFWRIEKWMWHVFKRQDGRVVGAGCLELEAKDTSCFGKGGKEKTDDVGIFVAEKWVDSVVSVERRCEREMIGHRQWSIKRSYSICASYRETRGGKRNVLGRVV